jgi:uncharacterized membrane protein
MKSKTVFFVVLIVGIVLMTAGKLLSNQMGASLATHWNAAGEADGYGSTFTGLYLIPILTIILTAFILAVPNIDPLKANIETFRSDYHIFVLVFAGFMYYVYSLTLAWNMGLRFSMNALLTPAFGLFFILTGRLMLKAKRNYFIGIRTPWTLANDEVWRKTHQLGGKLFIISGILTAATVLYPPAALYVLLATSIVAANIAIVYSYFEFRKIENKVSPEK